MPASNQSSASSSGASSGASLSHADRQEKRLQELEFVVAHLQKNVDDLNEGVLLQQRTIDILCRQLEQAKSDMRSMAGTDTAPRSLADEKPPHY